MSLPEGIESSYYPIEIEEAKMRLIILRPLPRGVESSSYPIGSDFKAMIPLNYSSNPHQFLQINPLICMVSAIGLAHCSIGVFTHTLKLIDLSTSSRPLSVTFVAPTLLDLPHVRSVGDTISIKNLEMCYHNGDIVGNVKMDQNSSYALFSGKDIRKAYCATGGHRGLHYEFDKKLATVSLGNQYSSGRAFSHLKIKDVKFDGVPFDLVCKIVNITADGYHGLIICVWDGTTFQSNVEIEEETPAPYLQVVPYLGTILKIRVGVDFKDANRLQSGNWIRMQKLLFELQSDKWRCEMRHPESDIFIISEDDLSVRSSLSGHTLDFPMQGSA